MTNPRISAARLDVQSKAKAIGIDEAYISVLVDRFYGHIRNHAELGPIFQQAIGENWDVHLTRMKAFWSSVALNSGVYSGKPVPAHYKHKTMIEPAHFETWLALFRQTLEETAETKEAVDYFMLRANRIAKSLQLALFGMPGLGAPQYG